MLDLTLLATIDSCGLAALFSLGRSARAAGGRVIPRGGSAGNQRTFQLTGLDSLFAAAVDA